MRYEVTGDTLHKYLALDEDFMAIIGEDGVWSKVIFYTIIFDL